MGNQRPFNKAKETFFKPKANPPYTKPLPIEAVTEENYDRMRNVGDWQQKAADAISPNNKQEANALARHIDLAHRIHGACNDFVLGKVLLEPVRNVVEEV